MSLAASLNAVPMPVIFAIVAVFGALVGSFLNVVILRVPEKRSIVYPGSHCPSCQAEIHWYDNIPVLSWIVLGGKCRACNARISVRYLVVEVMTAALFVAIVWRFGLRAHTPAYLGFTAVMIALTFIDLDHRIIPNVISLPGIVVGFALAFVIPHPEFAWISLPVDWRASAAGIIAGGGFLAVTAIAYEFIAKREGMGFGDVKMLAMIGAFLGLASVPFVILVSAISGAVIGMIVAALTGGGRKTAIPFGPFLALGAVVYLFVGPEAVSAYLRHSTLRQQATVSDRSSSP